MSVIGASQTVRSTPATDAAAAPVTGRVIGRGSLVWIKILSVVATLGIWEVYGWGVNPIFFSYPSAIVKVFPDMVLSGELWDAIWSSLKPLAVGWGAAIAFGVVLGLMMGRYPVVDALLDLQLTALYAVPTVALTPLFVLWFGLGFEAKVAMIFLSALFPVAINSQAGARAVTRDLIDIARVENARELQVFRKIVLPASLPFILTGIRLSVGRAVIGMVVAEMYTALSGLGGATVKYSGTYKMDRLFVAVIVLALLGILLTAIVKWMEQVLMPWRGQR